MRPPRMALLLLDIHLCLLLTMRPLLVPTLLLLIFRLPPLLLLCQDVTSIRLVAIVAALVVILVLLHTDNSSHPLLAKIKREGGSLDWKEAIGSAPNVSSPGFLEHTIFPETPCSVFQGGNTTIHEHLLFLSLHLFAVSVRFRPPGHGISCISYKAAASSSLSIVH